jgi:hypothetical protein
MDRFQRIAARVASDVMGLDPMAVRVAEFLKEHPAPSDSDFHEWAEAEGIDKHAAEAAAYRLGTLLTTFLFSGRANEEGLSAGDADPTELAMGIEIEMEHTSCMFMAERIALDHLAEIADYYTRLKKMEEEAGVED